MPQKKRESMQSDGWLIDCQGAAHVGIVQISFANRSRWLKSKPFVARFAPIKILDNSRQNFFAHVRDLSNCEKIAIRATRIMPAR